MRPACRTTHFVWYSLYCGGLEQNPQYLRGMTVHISKLNLAINSRIFALNMDLVPVLLDLADTELQIFTRSRVCLVTMAVRWGRGARSMLNTGRSQSAWWIHATEITMVLKVRILPSSRPGCVPCTKQLEWFALAWASLGNRVASTDSGIGTFPMTLHTYSQPQGSKCCSHPSLHRPFCISRRKWTAPGWLWTWEMDQVRRD